MHGDDPSFRDEDGDPMKRLKRLGQRLARAAEEFQANIRRHETSGVQYCSFCAKSADEVSNLAAGGAGVSICDGCLGLCMEILRDAQFDPDPEREPAKSEHLHCSICAKSHKEVRRLIAGPSVFICDACVESIAESMGIPAG